MPSGPNVGELTAIERAWREQMSKLIEEQTRQLDIDFVTAYALTDVGVRHRLITVVRPFPVPPSVACTWGGGDDVGRWSTTVGRRTLADLE